MPTYVYECKEHGRVEIVKGVADVGDFEFCGRCEDGYDGPRDPQLPLGYTPPMRRIFTPPTVQNLTASRGSLRSWGRDLRLEGTKTMEQKIAECEAARGESKAATLGEAG